MCEHQNTQIVKYQQMSGGWRLRKQCISCGRTIGSDLKMAGFDLETIPPMDEELRERGKLQLLQHYKDENEKRNDEWRKEREEDEIYAELVRRSSAEEWWRNYNDYLHSQQWQQLRRKVLFRDGFLCQNCFRKITDANAHVHHMSYAGYKNVGKSFAFECISLCKQCHVEFHPHMETAHEITS